MSSLAPSSAIADARAGEGRAEEVIEEGCEGRVKYFNVEKGFGTISYRDEDVFVHRNQIRDAQATTKDQFVQFDVVKDLQGRTRASNVRISQSSESVPPPDTSAGISKAGGQDTSQKGQHSE